MARAADGNIQRTAVEDWGTLQSSITAARRAPMEGHCERLSPLPVWKVKQEELCMPPNDIQEGLLPIVNVGDGK